VLRLVTLLLVVERPVLSDASPVEADAESRPTLVESEAALLLVVERPVLSDASPVEAEVLSDVTLLLVVDRPVESEATLLTVVLATEYSWLPFTASVEVAVTWPAATLMTWRSPPTRPTLTTPFVGEATPANPPKVVPPMVALEEATAALSVLLLPSTTLLACEVVTLLPTTKVLFCATVLLLPRT